MSQSPFKRGDYFRPITQDFALHTRWLKCLNPLSSGAITSGFTLTARFTGSRAASQSPFKRGDYFRIKNASAKAEEIGRSQSPFKRGDYFRAGRDGPGALQPIHAVSIPFQAGRLLQVKVSEMNKELVVKGVSIPFQAGRLLQAGWVGRRSRS
ncbi:hypothetical protein CCP3SC15_170008 [Gammaproteobacteria bacterium]